MPVERLLAADASRFLRNLIAHGEQVPLAPDDFRVTRWKLLAQRHLERAGWPGDSRRAVQETTYRVFGRVTERSNQVRLPAVYLYMLYSFTNLAAFALAIEEALFDPVAEEAFVVRRQAKYVRRTDLIVEGE